MRRLPRIVDDPGSGGVVPGCALVRPGLVYWRHSSDLRLLRLWGQPDRRLLLELLSALSAELTAATAPYRSFVDLRAVRGVPDAIYDDFVSFMGRHRAALARSVRASALVARSPYPSALAYGYQRLVGADVPTRLCSSEREALAWLDHGEDASAILAIVDELEARVRKPALVDRLENFIAHDPAGATLQSCSRQLAMSTRQLQRELREAGTSFSEILLDTRLQRASALLSDSDAKLHAIALDVGFAKAGSLIAAFRRRYGVTPGQYRRRRQDRAGARG